MRSCSETDNETMWQVRTSFRIQGSDVTHVICWCDIPHIKLSLLPDLLVLCISLSLLLNTISHCFENLQNKMATTPQINSGIVTADHAYPNGSTGAPSQASQNSVPPHANQNHTLAPNHESVPPGGAGGARPFPPSNQHGNGVVGGETKPQLPSRNGAGAVGHQGVVSGNDGVYPDAAGAGNGIGNGGAMHHPGYDSTGTGVHSSGGIGNGTTTTTTTTATAPVDNRSTGSKVKGVAAAIHGMGEALRGTFNREVDRAFGDVCSSFSLFFLSSSPFTQLSIHLLHFPSFHVV
jgi:hypothetical protein